MFNYATWLHYNATMSHIDLRTKNEKLIYKLIKANHALSAVEIKKSLPEIDKATVYRIIARLVERSIIKEIFIDSNKSYYELVSQRHHHHIICKVCNKIIPIVISEKVEGNIQNLENRINKELNFNITSHLLTFYGSCKGCN